MKFTAALLSLLSTLPSPVHGIADQVGHFVMKSYNQDDFLPIDSPAGEVWQQFIVTHQDTERIVLHFESMNIADSCTLYTQGEDHVVVQKFTNTHKFNNYGEFFGFSIESSKATLTLKCANERSAGSTRIAIDKFAVSDDVPSVASICAPDDKVNAICYKDHQDHTDIYEKAKAACRVIIGAGACTGWLVGISQSGNSLLITNQHCIDSQSDVINSSFQFMAENSNCPGSTGGGNSGDVYGGKTLIKVESALDYALVELEPNADGNHAHEIYGYFELEDRLPVPGEKIYIPQHAGGRMKQLGVVDTDRPSGVCEVQEINVNSGCVSSGNVDFRYTCDTEGGSSGSPVVLYDSNKIIGLHHCGGGCGGNLGVMIKNIADAIADDLIRVPTGAPVPTAAPEPTASPSLNPTATCDTKFRLTVKTDNYATETDFELKGEDNDVYMTKDITLSANTEYVFDPACIPAQGYEFTITDSYGDGICCQYGQGFYKYSVDDTDISHEGGEFTDEEKTTFDVQLSPPVSDSDDTPSQSPVSSPVSSPVADPVSDSDDTPSQSPVFSGPCDHLFKMTVQIDNNGGQTSYQLKDDDDTVVFDESDLSSGSTVEEEACLNEGKKYTYTITDEDGICCSSGSGSYVLSLNNKVLAGGGEFESHEKVTFKV